MDQNCTGTLRYPSTSWMNRIRQKPSNLRLSAHLCGASVRRYLHGKALRPPMGPLLARIQLNQIDLEYLFANWPRRAPIQVSHGVIILVCPDPDARVFALARAWHANGCKTAVLIDDSRGTGRTRRDWPQTDDDILCGFAGGIGPDNIRQTLDEILDRQLGKPFWIDMESKIRGDDGGFSVEKATRCLEIADDWMRSNRVGIHYETLNRSDNGNLSKGNLS